MVSSMQQTLQSCPACGREISSQAYRCPNCGHPLREKSQAQLVLWLGILSIYPCFFLSPIAWTMGNTELEAIDAGLRPEKGRRRAVIGRRLGIIGTVVWGSLLALVVIAVTLEGTGAGM